MALPWCSVAPEGVSLELYNGPQISKIEYNEGHLAVSALINIKQTRSGMSMTEKIALMIDVPERGCYV